MLIGIISDTHLGGSHYRKIDKNSGLNRYLTKTFEVMEWSIKYFKDKNINTIIHAGDLFDNPNVNTYSLNKTKEILKNVNMHVIKGNHDDTSFLHINEISALDLVGVESYNYPRNKEFDGVNFVFIPWGYEINENLINKNKKNVLIAHGFPRNYISKKRQLNDTSENIDGILSNKTKLFDLVITGHYHDIDEFNIGKTKYLNPGSICPSINTKGHEPSIWVLNTYDLSYERIVIPDSIKVIRSKTDNINEYLDNINDENIYKIESNKKPDRSNLIKAMNKAIDIQINIETKERKIEKIDDFWNFVQKEYPEYEKEFRTVIENRN